MLQNKKLCFLQKKFNSEFEHFRNKQILIFINLFSYFFIYLFICLFVYLFNHLFACFFLYRFITSGVWSLSGVNLRMVRELIVMDRERLLIASI